MMILGIDPGLSGAIAFLDVMNESIVVMDMPTVELQRNGKTKREVSPVLLADMIAGKGVTQAFVERVSAMPGQGGHSPGPGRAAG